MASDAGISVTPKIDCDQIQQSLTSETATLSDQSSKTMIPELTIPLNRTSNMYAQLETMMSAVKKEALALEAMKQKIKDMDELRRKIPELTGQLATAEGRSAELQRALRDSEMLCQQLRNDMQRLNDLYNNERREHMESKQRNMQVESEFARIQQEAVGFQRDAAKVGDLKKKTKELAAQLIEQREQRIEEKEAAQITILGLEKRLEEVENERVSTSSHFWTISEEIGLLKEDLKLSEDNNHVLRETIQDLKCKMILEKDRTLMMCEDLAGRRSSDTRGLSEKEKLIMTTQLEASQAEAVTLRSLLVGKEEMIAAVSVKLRAIEDIRQSEKDDIKSKMAEYAESIANFKSQNHTLERQASEATHKLGLLGGDVSRLKAELENAHKEVSRVEAGRIQREADFVHQMQAAASHKDEMAAQLQTSTVQIEVLQTQVREMQARHWEDLQRTKMTESQISVEVEALQHELQEKTVKLVACEAEKAKLDDFLRTEIGSASQMTNALRTELEKRLEELTNTRKERDAVKDEKVALTDKVAELEATIKKNEASFRTTMEVDRSKIQQEVRSKMNRLKSLEVEKQELLRETHELMTQITEAQREITSVRQEALKFKNEAAEYEGQFNSSKALLAAAETKLAEATKREQEQQEHCNKLEIKFRDDTSKLEGIVRESKKAAAQQVLEISARVKGLVEDSEMLKKQKVDLEIAEKRAVGEVEKIRVELDTLHRAHSDMQQQMVKDVNTLKRDNQELRGKIKLMVEGKGKMDMDMMAARLELTRAENEIVRLAEWSKDVELKLQATEEQVKAAKAETDSVNAEYRKGKAKIVDLEETLAKKNNNLEKQMRELGRLEREGLAEARRLRLQLSGAEREVIEQQAARNSLEKELVDGKASFARLQQSTNSTVNGLLAELKSTEDALSSERKKSHNEIEICHAKIVDLQSQLERVKESYEDHASKVKADKNDKELRVMQLDGDLERTKTLLASKGGRIEELEKQHQADRLRIHELKDQLEASERAAIDSRATLELEQAQRKRLEARLRQAEADLAEAAGSSSTHGSPHSKIGSMVSKGTKMGSVGGGGGGGSSGGGGGGSRLLYNSNSEYSGARGAHGGRGREEAYEAMPYDDTVISPVHLDRGLHRRENDEDDDLLAELGTLDQHNRYHSDLVGEGEDSTASYFRDNRSTDGEQDSSYPSNSPREKFGSPVSGRGRKLLAESGSGGGRAGGAGDAQSPVLDRVSAALAARAQAETSKSALQRAQTMRMQERRSQSQSQSGAAGGAVGGAVGVSNGGMVASPASASSGLASGTLSRGHSFSRVEDIREVVQKASAAISDYQNYDSSLVGQGYAEDDKRYHKSGREAVSAYEAVGGTRGDGHGYGDDEVANESDDDGAYYPNSNNQQSNAQPSSTADSVQGGGDVQESISRTQMFLQQRLAGKAAVTAATGLGNRNGGGAGAGAGGGQGIGSKKSVTHSLSASNLMSYGGGGGGGYEDSDSNAAYLAAAQSASALASAAFSRHQQQAPGMGASLSLGTLTAGARDESGGQASSRSDPMLSGRSLGSSRRSEIGHRSGQSQSQSQHFQQPSHEDHYDADLRMTVPYPTAVSPPSHTRDDDHDDENDDDDFRPNNRGGSVGESSYNNNEDDVDLETREFMGAAIKSHQSGGGSSNKGVTKKKNSKKTTKKTSDSGSSRPIADQDSAFLPKIAPARSGSGGGSGSGGRSRR